MKEKYIRCSSLTSYPYCNRAGATNLFPEEIKDMGFELRETAEGIGVAVGTSAHAGVEYSLKEKMQTGKAAPLKDCIEVSVAEYESIRDESEIVFDSTTQTENEAKTQISEIQKAHYHFIQPELHPIFIEERLFVKVGEGFILSGQPDGLFNPSHVRDLKTGAKESNYMAQGGGYTILCKSNGYPADDFSLDYIPRPKKGEPVIPFEVKYDVKVCEMTAINTIKNIIRDYKSFMATQKPWAFSANPGNMLCTEKFCKAYGTKFCEFTYKKPIRRSFIDEP